MQTKVHFTIVVKLFSTAACQELLKKSHVRSGFLRKKWCDGSFIGKVLKTCKYTQFSLLKIIFNSSYVSFKFSTQRYCHFLHTLSFTITFKSKLSVTICTLSACSQPK